jgi:hypothetical protein
LTGGVARLGRQAKNGRETMRILLSSWFQGDALSVAQSADGNLHVIRHGATIISGRSLNDVIEGLRSSLPGVVGDLDWYVTAKPLTGPVHHPADFKSGLTRKKG